MLASSALWIALGITGAIVLAHVLIFIVFVRPTKDDKSSTED
ncbi:hypothetical protein [Haloferula sargassicola]|uniref:Uncharacterized protein n=1 Tax=Haloferula sargassicola TaxID=490096 RepID=A0ABP9UMZ2_9BACT